MSALKCLSFTLNFHFHFLFIEITTCRDVWGNIHSSNNVIGTKMHISNSFIFASLLKEVSRVKSNYSIQNSRKDIKINEKCIELNSMAYICSISSRLSIAKLRF